MARFWIIAFAICFGALVWGVHAQAQSSPKVPRGACVQGGSCTVVARKETRNAAAPQDTLLVVEDIKKVFDPETNKFKAKNVYQRVPIKRVASGAKFDLVIDVHNEQARSIVQMSWDRLLAQLETIVYPIISTHFYTESDLDGNGKIVVFFGDTPQHIAGYIQRSDLCMTCAFNRGEYIYVGIGSRLDDNDVATIGHELVHLVAANPALRAPRLPLWLDEALAETAEDMVLRAIGGMRSADVHMMRQMTFVSSVLHEAPFFVNNNLFALSEKVIFATYAKWGLFGQYVRAQFAMRQSARAHVRPFQSLIVSREGGAIKSFESLLKAHIDPTLTFGRFMTQFYVALVSGSDPSLYMLEDTMMFRMLDYPILYGRWPKTLQPGNAFVVRASEPIRKPVTAGAHIRYTYVAAKKLLVVTNEATDAQHVEPTM